MSFETFMARRYLTARNKPFFVSLLTTISIVAMTASVFAMIVVVTVMSGFEKDFEKKVLGFKAPLVLAGNFPRTEDWPREIAGLDRRILSVQPYLEGEGILQTGTGETLGVRIRGVLGRPSPERYGKLSTLEEFREGEIVLGQEVAWTLKVSPEFEDSVSLIFPFGEISPSGELLPTVRSLEVAATFRSGFYDYDSKYVLVPYQEAERLLGDYARSGFEIWLQPIEAVEGVKQTISKWLEKKGEKSFHLFSWKEQNPKLFAALKLEKIGMLLLLAILLFIASCTIFGLVSLAVTDRLREAAILQAIGMEARRVQRIFLLKAAGIGLIGDLVGGGFALALIFFLIRYPVRLPSSYYVEYLPLHLEWRMVGLVFLLAPLLAALTAVYPSRQVVTSNPVELLRDE